MEGFVAASKENAVNSMEMFLRNFSNVPDDKLDWAPTETARSALRIAAHTALYAGRFARMIRERKLPVVDDLAEWEARNRAEEMAISSREDVERTFREGTNEVIAALDTLTAEDLTLRLDSGQGWSLPMTFLVSLPAMHASLHTGQIDYLQTCWGDSEIYVG